MSTGIKGRLVRWLGGLLRGTEAVAATEYAILLALIVVVAMGTISTIGERFLVLYTRIADAVGGVL